MSFPKNLFFSDNLLPDGLNSHVGERGIKLSVVQIQRIAIVRCLYKESKVMIFDESTNALDIGTEDKILEIIFWFNKWKHYYYDIS